MPTFRSRSQGEGAGVEGLVQNRDPLNLPCGWPKYEPIENAGVGAGYCVGRNKHGNGEFRVTGCGQALNTLIGRLCCQVSDI